MFEDPRFPALSAIAYAAAIVNPALCFEAVNGAMARLLKNNEESLFNKPLPTVLKNYAIVAFTHRNKGTRPEPKSFVWLGGYYEIQAQPLPPPSEFILIGVIDRSASLESRLRRICDRITSTMSVPNAYNSLLTAICYDLSWDFGELWLPNKEKTHLYLDDSYYTSNADLEVFHASSKKFSLPLSDSAWLPVSAWQSNKTQVIPDVLKSSRLLLSTNRGRLRSAIAFPISNNNNKFGVFVFYSMNVDGCTIPLVEIVEYAILQLGMLIAQQQRMASHRLYLMSLPSIRETLNQLREAIATQDYPRCETIILNIEEALNELGKNL